MSILRMGPAFQQAELENALPVVPDSVLDNGLFVVRRPVMEWNKCATKRHAKFRKFVIHTRRNTREQCASDDTVRFQSLQRQREHALRDTANAPLDFVVAKLPFGKSAHNQNGPLVADAHEDIRKPSAVCWPERVYRNKFVRFAHKSAFLRGFCIHSILALRTACSHSHLLQLVPGE
jgi:hypothetical protein